jgi:hypothetical protein
MAENCVKHTFDVAYALCRQCGQPFCTTCLVYAFGPSKPPFCVKCAIGASGVRSNAAPLPVRSKQEVRRAHKDAAKEARVAKEAREAASRRPDAPVYGRPRMEGTAAATGTSPHEERPGPAVVQPASEKLSLNRLVARFRS